MDAVAFPRHSGRRGLERGPALLLVVASLALGGAAFGVLSESVGGRAPEVVGDALDRDAGVDTRGPRAWLFGGKLDLNRASAVDLSRVPGIGARLARAIVEERSRRGGFRALDEVDDVRGVGPAKLRRLARYVEVRPQRDATRDARPVTTVP